MPVPDWLGVWKGGTAVCMSATRCGVFGGAGQVSVACG